jgi:hypothetical protein
VPNFGRVFLRSNYSFVSAYCTLSVTSYSSYPLDLQFDNHALQLHSYLIAHNDPSIWNRCSQFIVVGSQWTTMTRVRVFL